MNGDSFYESNSLFHCLHQVIQIECPSCVHTVCTFYLCSTILYHVELLHRELRLQGLSIIYIYSNTFIHVLFTKRFFSNVKICSLTLPTSLYCLLSLLFHHWNCILQVSSERKRNRVNTKSTACQTQNTLKSYPLFVFFVFLYSLCFYFSCVECVLIKRDSDAFFSLA